MKVLGITDEFSGCGFYRVSLPVACLNLHKKDKLITNDSSEERFAQGWDVVLFNRLIDGLDINTLEKYRDKYGFKIVCDIDDYWLLDPHHVFYNEFKANMAEEIRECLRVADLVTCTHERLAKKVFEYNKNVVVIPNALPYGELNFTPNKTDSDKVRFIYAASITHERDVAILRNPFKKIASDPVLKEKCEFILAGYEDSNKETKEIWLRMLNDFSCHDKLNGKVKRGLPVTDYVDLYIDSDVSVIPLLDSSFNAQKSNLKVLEAAVKKNPAIVSHVNPYLDLPVRYINNQRQWYDNIKFYANETQARQDDGERLFEFCNEKFNLRKWSEYRKQVFQALIYNLKVA